MAYQAKRKRLYTEDFELTEEDGTVVHTIHVALDPDSMARKLSEKHMGLMKALQDVKASDVQVVPGEALESIGAAVKDILEAVFGADDTGMIMDFYDNRYLEMCTEVMPFVTTLVIPVVRKMAQENKRTIAAGYSRRQRHIFGRK